VVDRKIFVGLLGIRKESWLLVAYWFLG
jgi:hypothetical protein